MQIVFSTKKVATTQLNQKTRQKLNTEELSQTEQLVGRNKLNRFQELSAENKEANEEMIDFFLVNQGNAPRGGPK